MPRLDGINRILSVACGSVLLLLSITIFYKDAQTVLALIQLIVALIAFIFPNLSNVRPLFQRLRTTWFLSGILIISGASLFLALQPESPHLSIRRIEGDTEGLCGIHCTVTIGGDGITSLTPNQQLAVYGPQVRQAENDQYVETLIGIIRVLEVHKESALTQVVLIHEMAVADSSKRLVPNQLVVPIQNAEPYFLVPAFGDGYIDSADTIRLRPGTPVNVGDQVEVLRAKLFQGRILDHLANGTTLEIIEIGAEHVSVKTKLISGTIQKGDIVRIKPVTLQAFELTADRRVLIHYCVHAKHHWLTYQQIAPTVNEPWVYPADGRHGDYGELNTCRSAQVAQEVRNGDLMEFGVGTSDAPPNTNLTGTIWYRLQCCSSDGKLTRVQQ